MLAFAKLNGYKWSEKLSLPYQHIINIVLLVVILYFSYQYFEVNNDFNLIYFVLGVSFLYGIFFVAPIGGADMPVVISLLNSFTGLTAALTGIIFDNKVMLLGGILVGAAGTILTILMCKAMNRSLLNVIIGGFSSSGKKTSKGVKGGDIKEINDSDFAVQLFYSSKVIIVPGYGLAVAQAQKLCKEIQEILETNDVEVKYAIHPVAGRMPGHMNVLLAEANVPYDEVLGLDEINRDFASTDIVFVIGANDITNPAAKTDPQSPIYGMPILEVENAKSILFSKRSLRAGYAGVENELFFRNNTMMLFGDAKEMCESIINALGK